MLKIAYIATTEPEVKPKKLTAKQQLMQEALETLAILKHQNRLKALKKYAPELQELERKKEYLKQLENGRK